MVTPSGMGASFDVLLQFTMDEAANKRVSARVTTIEQELKRIQEQAGKAGKALGGMGDAFPGEQLGKETEKFKEKLKGTEEQAKKTSATLRAEARVLTAQAAEMVNGLRTAQIGALKAVSSQIQSISNLALVGGVGLLGGIFTLANNYVKDAKVATDVTREWEAATASLKQSQSQIGAVLAKEALPLLREAAKLADRVSDFVESHPEIASTALNAGKILITLGVLGTLASKGIKLIADVKYLLTIPVQLEAARLQDKAAQKQLEAALLRAKDLGVKVPTPAAAAGGESLPLISAAGLIVAGLIASGVAVNLMNQLLVKTGVDQKIDDARNKMRDQGVRIYPGAIADPKERQLQVQLNRAQDQGNVKEIERLRNEIDNLGNQASQTADTIERSITQLAGSKNEEAIVNAFAQWKEDDARLVSEAAENRKQIITDAEKAIAGATSQYTKQRLDINKRFDASRSDIVENFGKAVTEAEANYTKSRAQIIRDAGNEIERMEEQHQENIRKMTLDHNDRVAELTASRDALGLAKEARKFDQDLAESERGINREIAQRRQDTARRLAELAAEYAEERAQRQAEFQQSLVENEARRQEDLKAAATAHAEELNQIREQRAAQLRELQEGLNAERLRRREVFIAEIRDLDTALLGERGLKTRYYTLMLQDAEKWLAEYRRRLGGGTTTGSQPISGITGIKDSGGYVDKGIYKMAWDNNKEFVMSGSTTRAAERIIGGNLNQDILLRALQGIGGGRQATYVDQRRMERPMSKQERDLYKRMAIEAIKESYG